MHAAQRFNVFGEPVEVLVSTAMTNGSFAAITQTCAPGGGPPPHKHANEDEIFTVLEGEFELFDGREWHPLPRGEVGHALRGQVHTFRNCGTTKGKILIVATPGGLDVYLRSISGLVMPQDAAELVEISEPFGIAFVPPPMPATQDEMPQAGLAPPSAS
jgi:quercetin dioxygenase-like cupin family protein